MKVPELGRPVRRSGVARVALTAGRGGGRRRRDVRPGRQHLESSEIVHDVCGLDITSTQVSRAAAQLDEQLAACRNQPIGKITSRILDVRYKKVRYGGEILPCALLTATGMGPDGKRSIHGCIVQLFEEEPHWRF